MKMMWKELVHSIVNSSQVDPNCGIFTFPSSSPIECSKLPNLTFFNKSFHETIVILGYKRSGFLWGINCRRMMGRVRERRSNIIKRLLTISISGFLPSKETPIEWFRRSNDNLTDSGIIPTIGSQLLCFDLGRQITQEEDAFNRCKCVIKELVSL